MDDELSEPAAAHGVATGYRDGERRPVTVDEDVVVRVLGLLDVDATTPLSRRAALDSTHDLPTATGVPARTARRRWSCWRPRASRPTPSRGWSSPRTPCWRPRVPGGRSSRRTTSSARCANLPGTVHQYPNWRLPLPVTLEELYADPRVRAVVDVMRAHRG